MSYARTTALALCLASSTAMASPQLACHYNYGGEDKVVRTAAQADVYAVKPIAIGSYFLFRAVFDVTPGFAGIRLYTYVNRDESPALIHQASYAYPQETAVTGMHGFTGLQRVYEPIRDSELTYWCSMENL
jgi:hypothetical protein